MCHGPLFSKIVLFAFPLMTANLVQMLFNSVDLIVVGRYASHEDMAAVGSCGSLCSMLLSIFFGLSIGANVLAARYIGAKDRQEVFRTVHTAMAIAFFGGIVLAVIGILISRPILVLMQTPENVLPKASLYMWLYCAAIPFILIYNSGSSLLRAAGDTRRPMVFMIGTGFIKVCLNLFLVTVVHLDVAGVAVATLIANIIAAGLVIRTLTGQRDSTRLFLNKARIFASNFRDILKIGIPAGVQGALFGLSNMVIQSSVNSFGSKAMAGNGAAISLESIVYMVFISYYFAVISFVGQNHGAKKNKRIFRSILYCLALSASSAIVIGWIIYFNGSSLLGIFNSDPGVIQWGMIRLKYLVFVYFLCAIMETLNGSLRGLGHSLTPMVVTLLGACVFRLAWVMWVFPHFKTMENLLLSYSVSWILVCSVNGMILYHICLKLFRNAAHERRHSPYIRI